MTKLLATLRNGNLEPSEPIDLPEGTQLLITVNLVPELEEWTDEERIEFSLQGLNRAYGDDEPDYGEVETKGAMI
jgi:predicted DNA-binding antitoxin AbrB/MazE fold protein